MSIYGRNCSHPPKRKPKKRCNHKKLGLIMLLLGIVTILALFLPLKYWVLILSGALVVLGAMLCSR